MTQSTHEKIVRVGAIYDILAMAPFALPMVSVWAYSMIEKWPEALRMACRCRQIGQAASPKG